MPTPSEAVLLEVESWCNRCVAPARSAAGQVGIHGPELNPFVSHRERVAELIASAGLN